VGTGSAPAAGRAGKDVMGPHPIGSAPVGPRAGGLSRTELQLGQELPDVVIDVVADPARLLDGGVGRVIQGPVLIPLAGVDRAGVPATHGDDDVGRATTSSVNGLGNSSARSMSTSAIAATTAGWMASAGAEPAERTWTRPAARRLSRLAAIWERPAFCTHTNSTSGTSCGAAPLAWAKAVSRSAANRAVNAGR